MSEGKDLGATASQSLSVNYIDRLREVIAQRASSNEYPDFILDGLPLVVAALEAAQGVDDLVESALYRARALQHPGSKFHNLHMALIPLTQERRPSRDTQKGSPEDGS